MIGGFTLPAGTFCTVGQQQMVATLTGGATKP